VGFSWSSPGHSETAASLCERGRHDKHEVEGWTRVCYRRVMNPLILDARTPLDFSRRVVCCLLAAVAFVPLKWVRVKMRPFHNKSGSSRSSLTCRTGIPLDPNDPRCAKRSVFILAANPKSQLSDLRGHVRPLQLQRTGAQYFLRHQPNQADIQ